MSMVKGKSNMALSTMRMALRPRLLEPMQILKMGATPMGTSATEQMKQYWEKNQKLKRPNSPWIIYGWHFPMMTSLTHRFTGCVMTAGIYAAAIGILAVPMDVTGIIAVIKGWNLGPAFWFPMKAAMAFPLNYHYLNGIRHLYWDYKGGYEIQTQYKSGIACFSIATGLSLLFAGYAYM